MKSLFSGVAAIAVMVMMCGCGGSNSTGDTTLPGSVLDSEAILAKRVVAGLIRSSDVREATAYVYGTTTGTSAVYGIIAETSPDTSIAFFSEMQSAQVITHDKLAGALVYKEGALTYGYRPTREGLVTGFATLNGTAVVLPVIDDYYPGAVLDALPEQRLLLVRYDFDTAPESAKSVSRGGPSNFYQLIAIVQY